MMREFQILPQNLNFYPKTVKNWILPIFDHAYQKWSQMLPDLNSETRFEILSSFAAYMTHSC